MKPIGFSDAEFNSRARVTCKRRSRRRERARARSLDATQWNRGQARTTPAIRPKLVLTAFEQGVSLIGAACRATFTS